MATYECALVEKDWKGDNICEMWVEANNSSELFPSITMQEGKDLALAIVTVLVAAVVWRLIIKMI